MIGMFELIPESDKKILRELARRVVEIAAEPKNRKIREEWKRHNRLGKGKPMVRVSPEGSWCELIPEDSLQCSSELGRHYEMELRQRIYHWEYLQDDTFIAATVHVPLAFNNSGWGIAANRILTDQNRGAFAYDNPLKTPEDFALMKPPRIEIDEKENQRRMELVRDVFGDILEVKIAHTLWDMHVDTNLVDTLVSFRGNRRLMEDIYDRPQWVHEVLTFMTESTVKLLDFLEKNVEIELNNDATCNGLGNIYFTDELPADDFDGRHVRLHDLWGTSDAQEFASVSPEMHYEFGLKYQIKVLEKFGLNSYGCCEPLDRKLDYVKQIPRIRRISISPWANVRRSAEALQDKYILSWRPNPNCVAGLSFRPEHIRAELKEGIEIAREYNCVLEIILKDTHTVNNEPHRLKTWVKTAKELVGA